MKTFTYTIKDKEGIHARPAQVLVLEAKKYQSKTTIKFNEKVGDLKRIFSIMGLCVKCGETVTIEVEGSDEEACAEALQKVLEANL